MGIDDERVGIAHPREGGASPLGEMEEPAVRRVDVEPRAGISCDPSDLGEVVHGSGVGRPRARDDEEWRQPAIDVLADRAFELGRAHPETLVGRDGAHSIPGDARDARRLRHGVVHLVGRVEGPVAEALSESVDARRDDRAQVRDRAARRQKAGRSLGEARHLGEPPNDVELELGEAGRRKPHAHVAIDRARDEIGDRRLQQPATRDVAEIARPGRVETDRHDSFEEVVEEPLESGPGLGSVLGEPPRQIEPARGVLSRLIAERAHVLHDARTGFVEEPSQRVFVELELVMGDGAFHGDP